MFKNIKKIYQKYVKIILKKFQKIKKIIHKIKIKNSNKI